jgi:hypothetical protein
MWKRIVFETGMNGILTKIQSLGTTLSPEKKPSTSLDDVILGIPFYIHKARGEVFVSIFSKGRAGTVKRRIDDLRRGPQINQRSRARVFAEQTLRSSPYSGTLMIERRTRTFNTSKPIFGRTIEKQIRKRSVSRTTRL